MSINLFAVPGTEMKDLTFLYDVNLMWIIYESRRIIVDYTCMENSGNIVHIDSSVRQLFAIDELSTFLCTVYVKAISQIEKLFFFTDFDYRDKVFLTNKYNIGSVNLSSLVRMSPLTIFVSNYVTQNLCDLIFSRIDIANKILCPMCEKQISELRDIVLYEVQRYCRPDIVKTVRHLNRNSELDMNSSIYYVKKCTINVTPTMIDDE